MRSLRVATPLLAIFATFAFAPACSSEADNGGVFIGTSGSTSTGTGSTGSGSTTGMGSSTGTSMGGSMITVGSGGGGGGSGTGVEKCVGTSSTTTPVPPVLGFLIDTSGSMGKAPEGSPAGTPTKWVSTRDALTASFQTMAEGTGAGLIFYPNTRGGTGATGCINRTVTVPIAAINMMQRTSILNAIQRAQINGNTPTHDAYKFAVETVEASTLIGSKYVVLVTDGSPTFALGCVGDGQTSVDAGPIVAESAAALARGIKTFVIGSPGSEMARTSLSQIASQGGTPLAGCSDAGPNYCHFDMTTAPDLATALNDAFKAITGSIVSCSYTIPAASGTNVVDTSLVNVNLTNGAGMTPIPKSPDANCTNGWFFSPDMKQINLCPETCNQVKADMNAKVDIVLGCKTVTL